MFKKFHSSVPELAKLLGVDRSTVYRMIKQGKIQAAKVGRNFAVSADEQEYISIPQLANVLRLSRIAVYKQIKQGKIEAQKVGRNHLISLVYIREHFGEAVFAKVRELYFSESNEGDGKEGESSQ